MRPSLISLAGLVLAAFSTTGQAQLELGFRAVGGHLAYVSDATLGIAAGAEVGSINPELALTTDLFWWRDSEGFGGVDASWRDIAILAGIRQRFPSRGDLTPFFDAGAGVHLLKFKQGQIDDSDTKLGLYAGGGLEYVWSSKLDLQAAMRGHLTEPDFFSLSVGVSYHLGAQGAQ